MIAPIEVPVMKAIGTRSRSSTLSTPMWAAPRAPPPPSTRPMPLGCAGGAGPSAPTSVACGALDATGVSTPCAAGGFHDSAATSARTQWRNRIITPCGMGMAKAYRESRMPRITGPGGWHPVAGGD